MVGGGIVQSKPSAFVRYRQKPNFFNGKDDGVRISVCLETVLAMLYQHMDKYAFFDRINVSAYDVLQYATYEYWSLRMQRPFHSFYPPVYEMISEELCQNLVSVDHDGEYYEAIYSYVDAIQETVNLIFPCFDYSMTQMLTASGLLPKTGENNLEIEGIHGYVAFFNVECG